MKEFLEKTLWQNVIMTENKEVYKRLPLAYRGRYDIFPARRLLPLREATEKVMCLKHEATAITAAAFEISYKKYEMNR